MDFPFLNDCKYVLRHIPGCISKHFKEKLGCLEGFKKPECIHLYLAEVCMLIKRVKDRFWDYYLFYSGIETFLADKMAISYNETGLDKICQEACCEHKLSVDNSFWEL